MFGKSVRRILALFASVIISFPCLAGDWWSFQPPTRPQVPKVQKSSWPKNPIDNFVLAKLEQKTLQPAKPADKRTLIRRATFDLTGLPPTTQEVEAFLNDKSPDAFTKVIDRLLASPHYGERWGRHWLDVVRYTDAQDSRDVGGQSDVAEAWRYRDWVVRAFNDDLPYTKFIEQQIAGDLLPVEAPAEINTNAIIATGMYAIGNWGNGDADKDKILTDIADDQVDVTSKAFLGVTLACARCHDHKFDPLAQRDYYAMAGIFFSSHILPKLTPKGQGENILRIPLVSDAELKRRKAREERVTKLEQQIEETIDAELKTQSASLLPHVAEYLEVVGRGRVAAVTQQPICSDVRRAFRDTSASIEKGSAGASPYQVDIRIINLWRSYLGFADLRLLSKFVPNLLDKPGLHALRNAANADNPSAIANTTDQEIQFITIKMPPHSIAVHPPPSGAVGIAWKCPSSGKFTIKGHVTDADPNCGDGIAWKLSIRGQSEPLESGMISNGGEQPIHELSNVTMSAGDLLELQILPKGEYSCDSTLVEFEVANAEHTWKLQSDVLNDFASNPHADKYGNTSVWHFYDLSTQPADPVTAGSLLAKWRVTTNGLEKSKLATDLQQALTTKTNATVTNLLADLTNPRSIFWNPARSDTSAFSQSTREQLTALRTEADSIRTTTLPQIAMANGLQDGGVPESPHAGVHDVKIHIRGRYDRLGDSVPRGFPKVLALTEQAAITNGSGRVELAHWIASEKNPMTARVMVNRIWQHHFGEGIVRTPNNFGKLGTPPTHPELLDYLATEFVKSGWSIKAMHRAIMLSATYQQSSIPAPATLKADPDNLLFGHMNRQRLESELIRDSLLSVTGELDPTLFGKSIRDLNTKRRTLYVMTIRSDRATYQSLFDCADPNVSAEKRLNSTVAPQSLFLLNNEFAMTRAKELAKRALNEIPKFDKQRINWLYELLYSRAATNREIKLALNSFDKTQTPDVQWRQYCQVLLCANEFVYVD